MKYFVILSLFCTTAFAGQDKSVLVPTPADQPTVAVQTAVTDCCPVVQQTATVTQQRVEWEQQTQQVERQVTRMVPQVETVVEEVVTMVPRVVEQQVQVLLPTPTVYYQTQQIQTYCTTCIEPQGMRTQVVETQCVDCVESKSLETGMSNLEKAILFAERAIKRMTEDNERPGVIRRAKRSLALLVIRLKINKAKKNRTYSGVHK